MIEKNTPEQAPQVQASVNGCIMFQNAKTECILLTLQPGEVIPGHTNPVDVLFIGISGMGTLRTPRQTFVLETRQTLFVSSEEIRAWENHGSLPAVIMVVKLF